MSLKGKTIVFTGTLSMPRAEATSKAEAAGAKVTGAVSKSTHYLVAGPGAGSKAAEAAAKGVSVIDEAQFVAMLPGAAQPATPAAPAAKQPATAEAEGAPPKKARKTESKTDPKSAAAAATAPSPTTQAVDQPLPAAAAAPSQRSGKPAVDPFVPDRTGYEVYQDYTVKLNQTNIDGNNNKFYVIQVLQKSGTFACFTRWGRVGEPGQKALDLYPADAAVRAFELKFREKTKNAWSARHNFVKHADKYTLVDTDDQEGDSTDGQAPIGKLTKAQVEKGQAVLGRIEASLQQPKPKPAELTALSSEFFSLIPTNFGRQRPVPITTMEVLQQKQELLKFYLRMGFEEDQPEGKALTPIGGVMDLPLPATLAAAIGTVCASHFIDNSVKQGRQLAAKNAGAPRAPMNHELYGAIMLYTSNAIYRDLNKVLREENRKEVRKYLPYLRMLLEAANRLQTKNIDLWRGVSANLFDQYKVGSTVTWWGVSSCTTEESVARNFAGGLSGDASLLRIHSKTACDISAITFYSNEKESILLPGTQLLVKSSSKKGKLAEIELEEVGRAVS